MSEALDYADQAFRKWLGNDYDLDVLHIVLAVAAGNELDGDPAWLLVVAGSGSAKTESLMTLEQMGATVVSSIASEGALLSATSKKEATDGSTGGLLRSIGSRGVLVIKDVTTILSQNRDTRASVLAALREVYDGRWTRFVGTDGGQTLEWAGRLVVVGAVTTAWDQAHAVVAEMGDRFVLVRFDTTKHRAQSSRRALGNTGNEVAMRRELANAVRAAVTIDPAADLTLTDDQQGALIQVADTVTLARTAVIRDQQGNVVDAHAPEMPTRFAKQLAQVARGAIAIGLSHTEALRLALRVARDSLPPLRRDCLIDLAAHPASLVADVRKRLNKPRTTVDRELQALHMLGVVTLDEIDLGTRTEWRYSLNDPAHEDALRLMASPEKSVDTHTRVEAA
ncbi:MAG: hypothetical protein RJQ01_00800 [Microcella sp.]|uniref:hypothetical protein n=1 Tax=Microcella sp. TaxID=1913979 RepID=UPI00331564D7